MIKTHKFESSFYSKDVCNMCQRSRSNPVHEMSSISDEQLAAIANRGDDETITRMAKELMKARLDNEDSPCVDEPDQNPKKIVSNDDVRYRELIKPIANADAERLLKKDVEYGASWKKRGGVGAFFTMIRKVDRLNTQLPSKKHGYDIIATLADNKPGEETLLDTIRDLRGYLILIEAEYQVRLGNNQPNIYTEWPMNQPKRYNGSGEPCDMWTGPCCCGATHKNGV